MEIKVDGHPVVISAEYINRSREWNASQYIGEYNSLAELNADMPRLIAGIPSQYWTLEFQFQDKEDCNG